MPRGTRGTATDCYRNCPRNPHLQLRGRCWSYRRAVPEDIRERLARSEIVRALGTESLTRAERLADALDERVGFVFEMARRDEQVDAEALIERVCDRYLRQLLAEDRASRRTRLEFGDVDAGLGDLAEHLAEALARRDTSAVRDDASELLRAEGIDAGTLSPETLGGLLVELLRTRVKAIKRSRSEREAEESFEDVPRLLPEVPEGASISPMDTPQPTSGAPGKTLGELVAAFVADRKSSGAWSHSTPRAIGERERELRLLLDVLGEDEPAREIGPEDILRARTEVSEKRSVGTVRKILGNWIAAFNFAERMRWIDYNPARHLRPKEQGRASEQRDAFTDAELGKLFGPEMVRQSVDRGRPERLWVPLLMLFTGARVGEAAQLETFDVREVDGVPWVEFTGRALGPDGKTDKRPLKTANAERVAPLHSELIRLGFLGYVEEMREAGERRLFPKLNQLRDRGPAEGVLRWFTDYRRKVGVTGPTKVLYSLRHTFTTRLKYADVQEATIAELVGHANASITSGRYGKRLDVRRLRDAVEKLDVGKLRELAAAPGVKGEDKT